jgi:ABC-2 type transport system permease protein
MSPRVAAATALRVLTQLRRDPRTVALLLLVPPLLLVILKYAYEQSPGSFDAIAPPLVGLFPFITMFIVTSITMLRERTGGTLERLMTMPLAKLDVLVGYGAAFALVAAAQACVASFVAFAILGVDIAGSIPGVVLLAIGNAVLGMSLGLFASAFARTEFQAVQFMPAFITPQLLLCGLFVDRSDMADALQVISAVLPLTYAFDALKRVAGSGAFGARGWLDVAVICGVTLLGLLLGAATLRRRTE